MTLLVHFNRLEETGHEALEGWFREAAEAALLSGGPRSGELSVTFVTASEMGDLNRRYLKRDGPTDVIAFDLSGDAEILGDVYICPEEATRNALERNVDQGRELARLVIHGALHVLGHDHPESAGRESSPMFELQEELLRGLASD